MNPRLLIVEDEAIVAADLEIRLRELGYAVAGVAHTGEDALEMAALELPDLVLMDIHLGDGMDGIEAARQLKARHRLPTIFLTAYAEHDTLERAKLAEPFGYILKPFSDRELEITLQIGIYKHRTERKLQDSEHRFRTTLQTAMDGYWVVDLQGNILEVNNAVCRMSGYSEQELLSMRVSDLEACEDQEEIVGRIRRILSIGEDRFETQHRRKDGTLMDLAVSTQYLNIDGGRLVAFMQDITDRKHAEAEARRYQAQLEAVFDNAPLMICILNSDNTVERMNRAMTALMAGPDREWFPGPKARTFPCISSLSDPSGCGSGSSCHTCPIRLAIVETFRTGLPHTQVEASLFLARQGVRREIRLSASTALVHVAGDQKLILCLEDITQRLQLERQFQQAQKMEAVGQLAGGVAHDFNNILAAIIMHLHLLSQTHSGDTELLGALQELRDHAQRAADLTRQLLLFSRKQILQRKRLDINKVFEGFTKMLSRILGDDMELKWDPSPQGQWVDADVGMLEQVIMNLCVNARDAMPRGGHITVTTTSVEVNPAQARLHPDAVIGSFVCFSVRDTGSGMNEATLKHIFEPFFTTKEQGKGTGLGLATVYGIVRQHQGWVEVDSILGTGTTFRVYLPRSTAAERTISATETTTTILQGSETILLVEDEPGLLRLASSVLRRCGYQVLEACNGVEGLRLWETSGASISLLLTDMVMPGGLGGLELARRLREYKPSLKIILCSGYSLELINQDAQILPKVCFLSKPYAPSTLSKAVRLALDQKD